MFRRLMLASLFVLSLAAPARAEEAAKPDDSVTFDLSGEDWVATKTAHVTLDVEAAVTAINAGSMRADMIKSVSDAAKGDWRLISFNRSQDQTGLERWSVAFDSRLPENELGGLADAAKKASKAGMQITVGSIDFSPTLDEIEAANASLRAHILKEAADQLVSLNTTFPGRTYRIAQVTFDSENAQPTPIMRPRMMLAGAMAAASPPEAQSLERSQKITLTAHVTFAALPPTAAATH